MHLTKPREEAGTFWGSATPRVVLLHDQRNVRTWFWVFGGEVDSQHWRDGIRSLEVVPPV